MIQHVNFCHVSYPFSHAGDASQELLPPVAALHAAGGQRRATWCPKKQKKQEHATSGLQKVARVCFIQVILRFLLIFFALDKSHESIDEKQNLKRERERVLAFIF